MITKFFVILNLSFGLFFSSCHLAAAQNSNALSITSSKCVQQGQITKLKNQVFICSKKSNYLQWRLTSKKDNVSSEDIPDLVSSYTKLLDTKRITLSFSPPLNLDRFPGLSYELGVQYQNLATENQNDESSYSKIVVFRTTSINTFTIELIEIQNYLTTVWDDYYAGPVQFKVRAVKGKFIGPWSNGIKITSEEIFQVGTTRTQDASTSASPTPTPMSATPTPTPTLPIVKNKTNSTTSPTNSPTGGSGIDSQSQYNPRSSIGTVVGFDKRRCTWNNKPLYGTFKIVDSSLFADMIIYVSNSSFNADLNVFEPKYSFQASSCGEWYINQKSLFPDFRIFFTKNSFSADLTIYPVKYSYQAGL